MILVSANCIAKQEGPLFLFFLSERASKNRHIIKKIERKIKRQRLPGFQRSPPQWNEPHHMMGESTKQSQGSRYVVVMCFRGRHGGISNKNYVSIDIIHHCYRSECRSNETTVPWLEWRARAVV